MSTEPIPKQYDSLIPSLVVSDAAKAIQFYKDVFGAQELMRMNYPDGARIAHAELKIREHVLMLGDECPEMGVLAPKPGGPMPVMDMFWGDRYGKFVDPFGHLWGVATHKKDASKEECEEGMKNWGKGKK
jgi:uncharacterized glyoxalase superfamily protein PhnB